MVPGSVACPPGKKVLGGGFAAIDDFIVIRSSIPPSDAVWNVVFKNESTTDTISTSVAVWAVCATVP